MHGGTNDPRWRRVARAGAGRFTYANVTATLALFLSIGGGGVAVASHLTVRSSDITDNAVLSRHIKGGNVKNTDLASDR